jgi:hypothetical protein
MGNVWLSAALAAEVNLLLLDPKTNRMRWGAWQALVEGLVRRWVEGQKLNPAQANELRGTEHRNMPGLRPGKETTP